MAKKLTKEQFIIKAQQVHGVDKYDYSFFIYKNQRTKGDILCKEHGIFKQTGNVHLSGCGCPVCSGRVKNNNENNQRIIKPKIKFKTHEETRIFISNLGFKNSNEFRKYCKSGLKPDDIPNHPHEVYKNNGWVDWYYFLNKEGKSNKWKHKNFKPFEESRIFISNLGFKNSKELLNYYKSGLKPDDIPTNPHQVYKNDGWVDMKNYLGTRKEYLPYLIAKKTVLKMYFNSSREYCNYIKQNNIENLPLTPQYFYKNSGWISWSNFLGHNYVINKQFLKYNKSVLFLKNLNIKGEREYRNYTKDKTFPSNIPKSPEDFYKEEWKGWAEFLGYLGDGEHNWNKLALTSFLTQFQPYLNTCSIPELLTIIESNNSYRFFKDHLKKIEETKPGSKEREEVIKDFIETTSNKNDDQIIEIENQDLTNEGLTLLETEKILNEDLIANVDDVTDNTDLQIQQLKVLELNTVTASLDEERLNFIITTRINSLWYDLLNDKLDIDKIINLDFPSMIKDKFIDEYNKVINLVIPKGYKYPYQPLLMQKLISYRLLMNKRYGNWSGVGAGKTIGAILAGRYVGVKNTLIITFNSTIGDKDSGWTKEIKQSFPDSKIYSKIDRNNVIFDNSKHNYLILNYETFQQPGAGNYVIDLLENNKFDYIILDEVQSVKQRTIENGSKRREIITGLINKIKEQNPDYYLLAMSATPVINNLTEAKSLIELITLKNFDDISTTPNISNCIELFRRLSIHGIRHKNINDNILKNNKHTLININGNNLIDETKTVYSDLDKDKLTITYKLDKIKPYLYSGKGKPVIYIHYVNGIEEVIVNYLENLGLKVGVYTGSKSKWDRSDSLKKFIKGDYDVFLGSRPISTGVDGLQKVSDRIIILSLPWTDAELTQLIGRVNRKGSNFKNMDVIIPLVKVGENQWDKHRYNTINFKSSIANGAVDGIIPEALIPPNKELIEEAEIVLPEWEKRLNKGDIHTINRVDLSTKLFPEVIDESERRNKIESDLIEFNRLAKITLSSNMNKKFKDNPNKWFDYHKLRNESMRNWSEIPYEVIAKKIKDKKNIVVDFGCGENKFKDCIPNNKVFSFDHIAIDDNVTACDMSDISEFIKNESVDISVFSLSLWGKNYIDYLKESYRILKNRGIIYIAEPVSVYNEEKEQQLKETLRDIGFEIIGDVTKSDKFIYFTGIKL